MYNWSQRIQRTWLWLLVNVVCLGLAVRTTWMVSQAPAVAGWVLFTDSPALRNIVLFTGKSGLILLVLSLACTPVSRLLGWTMALQVRKALGLWGFGFACFHSLFFLQGKPLFADLNIGPALWAALQSMIGIVRYGSKVPYAEAGVYALLLLTPLALTSNRLAMRRLGKYWKRLHWLVYLAVPMATYHYWWRTLSPLPPPPAPNWWQPLLFAVGVGLLLLVRLPPVRRWVIGRLGAYQPNKRFSSNAPLPKDSRLSPPLAQTIPTSHNPVSRDGSPPLVDRNGSVQPKVQKQPCVVNQASVQEERVR